MRLKTKVIFFFFIVALISGGFIIGLTWRAVGSIETKNLAAAGLAKAAEMAEASASGFKTQSETSLLAALQMGQQAIHANYAAALDSEGRILAHTNVAKKGMTDHDPLTQRILRDPHAGTQTVKQDNESVLEVWSPVWMKGGEESNEQFLLGGETAAPVQIQRMGTIRFSLPMRATLQTRMQIIRQMSLIVALTGLFAFLCTLGLMRRLLTQIRTLAQGTARIAQGQYGFELPVASHDELGELASSFNRMSDVLSATTVSKNFLGDILSHMIDPLMVIGTDGTIQMVNQAAIDLLGYSKADLEGRPFPLVFPKDLSPERTGQEALMTKGLVRNLELEFQTQSGTKVPVLFSSSLLKDGQGRPTGTIAVAKDMTERKRLENIIRQSDKMSAVGQLATGVAHEINNPLGVILGFSQAALRRITPGEMLELPLRSIEKEAVRCKNLVQDLLTFSRVTKVEREPIDLNKTVEGALSLVTARARTTQVKVLRELSPDLPHLLGNPNQIQQIVVNLANNAFDAMDPRGGELTVKTESLQEGPLSWICLKMTDTGSGIPPDILSRIFEPFFTTKPVGKGTGLGLSLIHEMVKKHSGTIDVESRPGHTEFRIKFPIRLPQESLSHAG